MSLPHTHYLMQLLGSLRMMLPPHNVDMVLQKHKMML